MNKGDQGVKTPKQKDLWETRGPFLQTITFYGPEKIGRAQIFAAWVRP